MLWKMEILPILNSMFRWDMKKQAKLIVHTGSMFSGKTTSLWRELYRMKVAGYKTIAFKPSVDSRHEDEKIISHDNLELDAIKIESIKEILDYAKNNEIDAIGIDEVQFFPDEPSKIVDYFIKPLCISVWIFPAASTAFVPFVIVQALVSSSPVVKNEIKFKVL